MISRRAVTMVRVMACPGVQGNGKGQAAVQGGPGLLGQLSRGVVMHNGLYDGVGPVHPCLEHLSWKDGFLGWVVGWV
eukprot:9984674-Prorocentrum_lima.AAC.1